MKYPETLLPSTQYKCIDVAIPHHHVCRTTPSKDFIRTSSAKVKDEALYEDHCELFDYSTNLMGHFQLEHNYIILCGDDKKYFYSPWDFQETVRIPQHKKDFILNDQKGYFFFRIGDIHEIIKCPYSKPKNITGFATACIVHTPSRSNYWHFSIKWKDKDGIFINRNEAKWKYALLNTMRAALSELIIITTPQISPIPKNLFHRE